MLASGALLERIGALPAGVARRALGPLPRRGKEHALEIYALEAVDPSAPSAAFEPSPRAASGSIR